MRQITDSDKPKYYCYSWDNFIDKSREWTFPEYLLYKWEYNPVEMARYFNKNYTTKKYLMMFKWDTPDGLVTIQVDVEQDRYPEMMKYLEEWYNKLRILWEPIGNANIQNHV